MFLFIFGNGVNGLNVDVVNSVIVMKFFIFKYIQAFFICFKLNLIMIVWKNGIGEIGFQCRLFIKFGGDDRVFIEWGFLKVIDFVQGSQLNSGFVICDI